MVHRSGFITGLLIAMGCWSIVGCTGGSRQNPSTTSMQSMQAVERTQEPTRPSTPAKPVAGARPLIDFGRGAGGFPLNQDVLPGSLDELVEALATEYRARVALADDSTPIVAFARNYPHIDTLAIDLTDGQIKSEYRPTAFKAVGRLQRDVLHVDRLSYQAIPLRYVDGSTNLRITATDVKLGLLRGRGEQSALVMTEAKNGQVLFEVPQDDLRAMFLTSAKTNGSRAGFNVRDVQMNLISHDSRSLTCELKVRGFLLLLPAAFKITGRIDLDDQFNAHLSNVGCTAEDVGGLLIAGFIDGALKKYDGRVMPVASFPGAKIKIRDVKISVDESLRIHAQFSS